MPIIGLTDNIQPKFPLLGKLRKGGEKTPSGYGPDLDHFRFTSDNPDVVSAFVTAYGDAPRVLPVFIPYATPDEAFTAWCEVWNATGLVHRCDGVTMSIWLAEGGKYQRGAKPCMGGHDKGDARNDSVGRLNLILPELFKAGFVGYVTMETHSINDIVRILEVLTQVHKSTGDNPLGLRGIEFHLKRVQESISVPGFGAQAGKRSRVNKWLVRLEPAPSWVMLQQQMQSAIQAGETVDAPQLPETVPTASGSVNPTTGEIVQEGQFEPANDGTPDDVFKAMSVTINKTPIRDMDQARRASGILKIAEALKTEQDAKKVERYKAQLHALQLVYDWVLEQAVNGADVAAPTDVEIPF